MKRNEVLRYQLADVGPEPPVMSVHLHCTRAGYWRFRVSRNAPIDLADRLFDELSELAGLQKKIDEVFYSTPQTRRRKAELMCFSALSLYGSHFPDRESVVRIIERALLPCWRCAAEKIMENRAPDKSWYDAVRKTEKMQWSGESSAFRSDNKEGESTKTGKAHK